MTTAEKASLFVSIAAAITSIGAVYFQFFWRYDDLLVDWNYSERGWPNMAYVPPSDGSSYGEIHLAVQPDFVFVNAGNQSVGVTRIEWMLVSNRNTKADNVWSGKGNPPLTDCTTDKRGGATRSWVGLERDGTMEAARPFTLGPGQILPLRVSFLPMSEAVDDTWKADSEVTTCYEFEIVTATGSVVTRRVPGAIVGTGGSRGEARNGLKKLL